MCYQPRSSPDDVASEAPWTARPTLRGSCYYLVSNRRMETVARVPMVIGSDEGAANARLIAAAPMLREALMTLLLEVDYLEGIPSEAIREARAALRASEAGLL